jgi:ribosomal protein S18 acetylase RimI-like enzyme
MSEFEIRPIIASETYVLRRALLRPHQPIAEMTWPADDAPDTLHIGGFRNDRMVAVATIHRGRMPGSPETEAWRLRGVAVEHGQRGRGLGGMLVDRCLDHVATRGARLVWCHVRIGAFGFFEHRGFRRFGEPFDLPGVGPHYVMFLAMQPPS